MTKRRIVKSGCLFMLALLMAVGWLIWRLDAINPKQLRAMYFKRSEALSP